MQRACGTCVNCQKPHLKKGCLKLKALREADRASRHEAPSRRHKQSVDAIPLAKLVQQPATTPASPSSHQPSSMMAPLVRGSSPTIGPDTEAQRNLNWPENNKRAGTEDSENQDCQKKMRFAADNDKEPEQLPSSGMASRDTPDDSALFLCKQNVADGGAECNKQVHSDTNQATTISAEDLPSLLAQAKDIVKKLSRGSAQGYQDATKLAEMVAQVSAERKAFRTNGTAIEAGESRAKAAEDHLHTAIQSAQDLLKQLQQQKQDTDQASVQATAMSQQLQQDVKASQEAAVAAKKACGSLAVQKQDLLSVQQQLLDASQRAQQMSSNLEVDVGCAQESLDSQTRSFQKAKREAAAECSKLQAVMAAAKQQHQQHVTDIESHLQEATEATQHAQASEAEVKLTAERVGQAVKADQAAASAAAKQTEAALQLLRDSLADAARDHTATTQQHTKSLRGFILSAVHSAVCQATAGWQDVSGLAQDARGLLEEVSSEIRTSMQTANEALEERLRHVESAIASGSQTERVAQKFSVKNAQKLPVASTPSSRMQAVAPQRPGSALSHFVHMGAAQSMLACQETITAPAGCPADRAADQVKPNSLTAHMQAAPQH